MALVIETGTGSNPAANSYVDVAALKEYARLRKIDLGERSGSELEALLIKAMDFIEGQRHRFKGDKTNRDQPLQWPRKDVWDLDWKGALYPNNQIPRELQYAQMALAVEAMTNDLQPTRLPSTPGQIIREKVGPIETEYANTGSVLSVAAFAKADALLAPLYRRSGLTLVRS